MISAPTTEGWIALPPCDGSYSCPTKIHIEGCLNWRPLQDIKVGTTFKTSSGKVKVIEILALTKVETGAPPTCEAVEVTATNAGVLRRHIDHGHWNTWSYHGTGLKNAIIGGHALHVEKV